MLGLEMAQQIPWERTIGRTLAMTLPSLPSERMRFEQEETEQRAAREEAEGYGSTWAQEDERPFHGIDRGLVIRCYELGKFVGAGEPEFEGAVQGTQPAYAGAGQAASDGGSKGILIFRRGGALDSDQDSQHACR